MHVMDKGTQIQSPTYQEPPALSPRLDHQTMSDFSDTNHATVDMSRMPLPLDNVQITSSKVVSQRVLNNKHNTGFRDANNDFVMKTLDNAKISSLGKHVLSQDLDPVAEVHHLADKPTTHSQASSRANQTSRPYNPRITINVSQHTSPRGLQSPSEVYVCPEYKFKGGHTHPHPTTRFQNT